MRSIIYITNTQLPSQKANAYQSLCMCEAFANNGVEIELWHPARKGDYQNSNISDDKNAIRDIFVNSSITTPFPLRRLFSIDNQWIKKRAIRAWFYIQSFSFCAACIFALQKESLHKVIFIRDATTLAAFGVAKRLGLLQHKLIFEAHKSYKSIESYIDNADKLIVISHQLKKQLDPEDSKNVLVVHAGVRKDDLAFNQSDAKPLGIRQQKEDKIILYTGNLFRWKGVYTLADCMQHLPENYRIVFVGGSEDTLPEFRAYTKALPRIDVLGFRPRREINDYLSAADVLILPNSAKHDAQTYVTSPLKLFEYMSARKPIVAARLPSIQEILQDQENAILFSPDNAEDLANKIQWALSNDCSSLVHQAWQDVQTYTWNERAKQIIHTIGSLEPAQVEA